MEFFNQLLGRNSVEVWVAAVFWVLLSLLVYKVFEIVISNKVTYSSFKIKYWLNANIFVVILGVLLSLTILRLGDYVFPLMENIPLDFFKDFSNKFKDSNDFVAIMIPITWLVQLGLEKLKKPPLSEALKKEMHTNNCKH